MIWTFPYTHLVLLVHCRIVFIHSPFPLAIIFIVNKFCTTARTGWTGQVFFIACCLPGIEESHHGFGLWPECFVSRDDASPIIFIPQAAISINPLAAAEQASMNDDLPAATKPCRQSPQLLRVRAMTLQYRAHKK